MCIVNKRLCLLALSLLAQAEAFTGNACGRSRKFRIPSSRIVQGCLQQVSNISIGSTTLDYSVDTHQSTEDDQFKNSISVKNGGSRVGKRRTTTKARKHNPAMGDTAFLRKRTNDLIRKTSKEQLASPHEKEKLSRGMKVGLKTFNFLIDAWAFSGELDAADQALKLLERMEELEEVPEEIVNVRPDVRSYTKVINAVSRSMRPDAGEIAEEILDKMLNLHSSGTNVAAKPNTFTYTAVIEAYANSGVEGSAEKAEEYLGHMIQKYEDGDPDVKPTARCFNAAINAYAKSGYPGAAQQAEDLFYRMDGLYMSGVKEAKPNTFNYNSLITALANSREEGSAERAADVLNRMERCYESGDKDCKPTTVSFNAVIDAYAKSGQEGAAAKAEEVLRHMEDLYESGEDVKPNTRSFNSVLNAWAKSGLEEAPVMSQDLLNFMTRLYDEGNNAVRPDVHSFCTVINGKTMIPVLSDNQLIFFNLTQIANLHSFLIAWARSQREGKAERAHDLFQTMVKLYNAGNKSVKPNIVASNAVINACAYTNGDVEEQNRAMEIAHKQLKTLESSKNFGTPDQVTYGTFLKVCANQMPDCDTRQQIIEVIFKKCVGDGQVGNLVLQQLKAMGPASLYQSLVGRSIEEDIRMEDLPHEWRGNVVEGKWRRRRNLHS